MEYDRSTLYALNLIGFGLGLALTVSFIAILLGAENFPASAYVPLIGTPLLGGFLIVTFFKGMSKYAKPERKSSSLPSNTFFRLM